MADKVVGLREVGHALTASNSPLKDDNWELRWPQSVYVFAKMEREDAQVTSVLNAISLPIQRVTWRVNPNGAPDEIARRVADDLRLPLLGDDPHRPMARMRGRISWSEHLEKVLWALQFGHVFFEQVYGVIDGEEHLVKLAVRLPGSVSRINIARDGGLESIEQYAAKGDTEPPVIPVDRLVAYVYRPKDTTWTGRSVLRAAYKHWVLRDRLIRLEYNALDRNGMGVPVYTGSDISNDPDGDLAAGEQIATSLRSGESSGASIPAGAKLEIKGTTGQLASPREAITYHDSMMAKAVLAHFLNLEGKGGSYSLAETQADLFIQSLQTTADWIRDTANQHIVEDLVEIAFPEYDGTCPLIEFDPIGSKKELTAEALALLIQCGAIIPDKALEEDIRRRWGLPPKRPLLEALQERAEEEQQAQELGLTLTQSNSEGGGSSGDADQEPDTS